MKRILKLVAGGMIVLRFMPDEWRERIPQAVIAQVKTMPDGCP